MKVSVRIALFVFLAAVFSVRLSFTQQITGSVTGTVTDASGAAVSGAQARLTNTGTGAVASATSDSDGNFQFLLLPVGTYSLQVTNPGFKSFVREGIVVEVDRSIAVPVNMQVGQVSETVEVQGGADLLEPNTSSLGTVMEQKKVLDLPLNGRNPMGLANLIPTVKGIGYFGGQVLSSWRLAAVSIGGGQPLTNGFLVDGIANDKMVDSGPMTFLTVDSTEEFKVQTNGMSAEFGRTSGGVISMITKSGTNAFHGSLFEFLRNDALNANDFFANKAGRAIAPDKVNQFGGTFSGPLKRDKLLNFLLSHGIAAKPGVMAIHREEAYRSCPPLQLPLTERASDRSLLLPLYPGLTEAEQHAVLLALWEAFAPYVPSSALPRIEFQRPSIAVREEIDLGAVRRAAGA